jgi:hypothetical protein
MTKTEARKLVALAALLAGATAVAHEARARPWDPEQGLSPHGVASPTGPAATRAADPGRLRLRLRAARPAGE